MKNLERLCLVLNCTFEPINVASARRALTLVLKGAAIVQEPSAFTVKAGKDSFRVPSVIRLISFVRIPYHNRSMSRKGIVLRDRSTCQYCGKQFPAKELTMDHVIPKSRGGEPVWTNLVACCRKCNNKKGDRTPEEAGMTLIKRPMKLGIHAKHRLLAGDDDALWNKYLFV